MNMIEAFGVVSGVASIIGYFFAVDYAKKSRKEKLLIYDRYLPFRLQPFLVQGTSTISIFSFNQRGLLSDA